MWDFLLSREGLCKDLDATIAMTCLRYVSKHPGILVGDMVRIRIMQELKLYRSWEEEELPPFLEYAKDYWIFHLQRVTSAPDRNQLTESALALFGGPSIKAVLELWGLDMDFGYQAYTALHVSTVTIDDDLFEWALITARRKASTSPDQSAQGYLKTLRSLIDSRKKHGESAFSWTIKYNDRWRISRGWDTRTVKRATMLLRTGAVEATACDVENSERFSRIRFGIGLNEVNLPEDLVSLIRQSLEAHLMAELLRWSSS